MTNISVCIYVQFYRYSYRPENKIWQIFINNGSCRLSVYTSCHVYIVSVLSGTLNGFEQSAIILIKFRSISLGLVSSFSLFSRSAMTRSSLLSPRVEIRLTVSFFPPPGLDGWFCWAGLASRAATRLKDAIDVCYSRGFSHPMLAYRFLLFVVLRWGPSASIILVARAVQINPVSCVLVNIP